MDKSGLKSVHKKLVAPARTIGAQVLHMGGHRWAAMSKILPSRNEHAGGDGNMHSRNELHSRNGFNSVCRWPSRNGKQHYIFVGAMSRNAVAQVSIWLAIYMALATIYMRIYVLYVYMYVYI